ncbi:MAG: protein kinase [Thermodesulfobacteriota bacterium]
MTVIGDYKIIEKIGKGGMASVYKGIQPSLNRPVAIKVLSKVLAQKKADLERFNRESLIIAGLTHPNIISIIDRGITPEGMPYFVMEYVEGSDLANLIEKGNLNLNRKLDLMTQVCKALAYAHKNGVIHRDVKPANVLVDKEDNALVLDFGIAHFFNEGTEDLQRTQANVVMGTLSYMSPEQQISAKNVTALSDLFSLGVLMYELFTGSKPIGRFQPPSKIDPEIPKELEEVILRCMEPEPADRFASADEIKDNLLKILRGGHLHDTQRERAAKGITKIEEKYALLDVIKEDRHGAVYLYENKVDHKLFVIKKRAGKNRGYTEAKLLMTLKHKNIIDILGTSSNEKLFIVVMDYLSSGSLTDRLLQPFPLGEALRIAREICEGLSFAHKNRIVHGNLRPSNILFTEKGEVKITDFGLDEHYATEDSVDNWYQADKEPKSTGSDIFSAGAVFYQILTGSVPVWKNGRLTPHKCFNLLPIELRTMISRMVSLKKETRYEGFEQVIAEIDATKATYGKKLKVPLTKWTQPGEPQTKSRTWSAVLLIFVLLLAGVAVYAYFTDNLQNYIDAFIGIYQRLTENLRGLIKDLRN